MKRQITLKHIARELEVSISTVSKALKNSGEISKDTKEKIQAFAKLYNYKPNNIAISLKNKQTKNIAVIIPNIVHYFFATVFRGIEKYANSKGYNVIVCVTEESFDKEVLKMETLANGSVDGFIIALASETQLKNDFNHLREVTEQRIPLVMFDRVTNEIESDKVIINDAEVACVAVKKMITSGRKRIALLTTDNFIDVSKHREDGYRKALIESGIEIDEKLILSLPFDESVDGIEPFLHKNNIDAVLAVNEVFAVHAMRTIHKRGLRIPEDISFIGFTDGLLSKHSTPSLSTIAQHGDRMGEIAAQMLIDKVENEIGEDEQETYRTETIKATLIERESTNF